MRHSYAQHSPAARSQLRRSSSGRQSTNNGSNSFRSIVEQGGSGVHRSNSIATVRSSNHGGGSRRSIRDRSGSMGSQYYSATSGNKSQKSLNYFSASEGSDGGAEVFHDPPSGSFRRQRSDRYGENDSNYFFTAREPDPGVINEMPQDDIWSLTNSTYDSYISFDSRLPRWMYIVCIAVLIVIGGVVGGTLAKVKQKDRVSLRSVAQAETGPAQSAEIVPSPDSDGVIVNDTDDSITNGTLDVPDDVVDVLFPTIDSNTMLHNNTIVQQAMPVSRDNDVVFDSTRDDTTQISDTLTVVLAPSTSPTLVQFGDVSESPTAFPDAMVNTATPTTTNTAVISVEPTHLPVAVTNDTDIWPDEMQDLVSADATEAVVSIASSITPSSSPSSPPLTAMPTNIPTSMPTGSPTTRVTPLPTFVPTPVPTLSPTLTPTQSPSALPSVHISSIPSVSPTAEPTVGAVLTLSDSRAPTIKTTELLSAFATTSMNDVSGTNTTMITSLTPTTSPTLLEMTAFLATQENSSSFFLSSQLSVQPTILVTPLPTVRPTQLPSLEPTLPPTVKPTDMQTMTPTFSPSSTSPTIDVSQSPSLYPSSIATTSPTNIPTVTPTRTKTAEPTLVVVTQVPSKLPTVSPTLMPLLPASDTAELVSVASSETPLDNEMLELSEPQPTLAPTELAFSRSDDNCCRDDSSAVFAIPGFNNLRTCSWLRDNVAMQIFACDPDSDAAQYCPVTCGVCEVTAARTVKCVKCKLRYCPD